MGTREVKQKRDYAYKRRDGRRILGAWASWFLFKEKKKGLILEKNASAYETQFDLNKLMRSHGPTTLGEEGIILVLLFYMVHTL